MNSKYPQRELGITEHAGASLPFAVLAGVARLAGCALVAAVSKAFTGGREPARKEIIFSISGSQKQEG